MKYVQRKQTIIDAIKVDYNNIEALREFVESKFKQGKISRECDTWSVGPTYQGWSYIEHADYVVWEEKRKRFHVWKKEEFEDQYKPFETTVVSPHII
jgi:hypothetical protein